MKAADGNNIFVSIELGFEKQLGHEYLEVNDILTIHGREAENVVLPLVENESLKYVEKEKAHRWLSSVQANEQAITNNVLNDAASAVENFENPKLSDEIRPNTAEFMQRPEGTVYGWSEGNRIHLTPEGINPNTPVHEYTHLWARAVMQKNPKLWSRIKELLRHSRHISKG